MSSPRRVRGHLGAVAAAACLCLAATARPCFADGFITKAGTLGILDVPTAEPLGLGSGRLGFDFHAERAPDGSMRIGGLPLSVVAGLPFNLDLGLALRDSGLPGDPDPAVPLLTATAKVGILSARGWRPGLAIAGTFDRINWKVETALRVIASTTWLGRMRVSGFAGASITELNVATLGPIGGLAALVRLPAEIELAAEGLRTTRGWVIGGGVRWVPWKHLGLSASITWVPGDFAPRASLGLTIMVGEMVVEAVPVPETVVPEATNQPTAPAGPVQYADPRPRFRLRIRPSARHESEVPRHLQYAAEPALTATPPAPGSATENRNDETPAVSPTR